MKGEGTPSDMYWPPKLWPARNTLCEVMPRCLRLAMADLMAPPSSRGLGVFSRKPSSRTTHSRRGQTSWILEAAQKREIKASFFLARSGQLSSNHFNNFVGFVYVMKRNTLSSKQNNEKDCCRNEKQRHWTTSLAVILWLDDTCIRLIGLSHWTQREILRMNQPSILSIFSVVFFTHQLTLLLSEGASQMSL